MLSRVEPVETPDGTFDLDVWLPAAGRGPGLLLIQEIYGGSDSFIARDQVARVEQAAAARENVEVHVEEDAGHAFHNRKAPMFHVSEPAARAWQRTEDFLRRHLPARHAASTPAGPPG